MHCHFAADVRFRVVASALAAAAQTPASDEKEASCPYRVALSRGVEHWRQPLGADI